MNETRMTSNELANLLRGARGVSVSGRATCLPPLSPALVTGESVIGASLPLAPPEFRKRSTKGALAPGVEAAHRTCTGSLGCLEQLVETAFVPISGYVWLAPPGARYGKGRKNDHVRFARTARRYSSQTRSLLQLVLPKLANVNPG
jgi:hypothetical protein